MKLCDVCYEKSDASICDACAAQINNRDNPADGRGSPDPEYILFYQKNGYWPEW